MTAPWAIRPADALVVVDDMLLFARTRLAKAATPTARAARDKLLAERLPKMEADLAEYFAGFFERNLPGLTIEKALRDIPDPDSFPWAREEGLLRERLGRWYVELGEHAYGDASFQLGFEIAFDIEQPALRGVIDELGSRVKGITETSRQSLAIAVAQARETGMSVDTLERRLAGMFTSWTTSRAHMVALTESATAYALSSAAAWSDSGLVDEVRIFDGADCGWASHDGTPKANGLVVPLKDYQAQPLSHPHCQRAAAPIPVRANPSVIAR